MSTPAANNYGNRHVQGRAECPLLAPKQDQLRRGKVVFYSITLSARATHPGRLARRPAAVGGEGPERQGHDNGNYTGTGLAARRIRQACIPGVREADSKRRNPEGAEFLRGDW